MPRIPEEIIEDIRHRADIVDIIGSYLQLKRRGGDFWGLCPFHREKTPSFKVSAERQAFYCFGCKKSGNVFSFVEELENVDFVGAVELLAQRVGVRIPEQAPSRESGKGGGEERRENRARGYEMLKQLADWYGEQLRSPAGEAARQYCGSRGLDAKTITEFGIGYAPDSWDSAIEWGKSRGYGLDLLLATGMVIQREEQPERCYDRFRNRLMFPIHDELGRVVGFSARILVEDKRAPKYVNTPETDFFKKNRILYGLHLARHAFRDAGFALLCEGQLDVIACHRAGLTHAVSAQGTAFTENHARLLKRSTEHVVLAFDADEAGMKAAVRSVELLYDAGLEVTVVTLPTGQDPDGIFKAEGADGLQRIMSQQQQAVPFILGLARKKYNPTTANGRSRTVNEVLEVLSHISDPVTRAAHCQWLSQQLSLPEEAVQDAMNTVLRTKRRTVGGGRERDSGRAFAGPQSPKPPPFVMTSAVEQAFTALLDLALNSETAARKILESVIPETIPDTAIGRALNIVLAHTDEGEWELASQELVQDKELVGTPAVGRALNDPRFRGSEERENTMLIDQAVADCTRRVELTLLEEKIKVNQQAQQAEADPVRARALMEEFVQMQQQKRNLLNGQS